MIVIQYIGNSVKKLEVHSLTSYILVKTLVLLNVRDSKFRLNEIKTT